MVGLARLPYCRSAFVRSAGRIVGIASHMPKPLSLSDTAIGAIFHTSRIPMSLVDSERRIVAVNQATTDLFGYTREEMIGELAGRTVADRTEDEVAAGFLELREKNEYYGERVTVLADGRHVRVQFAGHGTTVGGQWMALFVTLSASTEPDGHELIGAEPPAELDGNHSRLTARECEVVRLVALGAGTRQIASELGLSPETVRSHVRNAMSKTESHTRAQLVAIALAKGLIDG
jgi:PAS domain S-box-containing protein